MKHNHTKPYKHLMTPLTPQRERPEVYYDYIEVPDEIAKRINPRVLAFENKYINAGVNWRARLQ